MSNINPPIQPGYPSKERLTVQQIEKLRADKELQEEAAKKNPQAFLMACFSAYAKKMALHLASRPVSEKKALGKNLMVKLSEFKKTLIKLMQENLSQNADFVEKLSLAWQGVVENIRVMEKLKPEIASRLKTFTEAFESYPHKDHSLAFYMSEWKGKEWLPFPFIEILHGLHEEYRLRKSESQLSKWINAIDSLNLSL